MKKHWLAGAAMLMMTATGAWAADEAAKTPSAQGGMEHHEGMMEGSDHDWTLEEARKKAHEHAEKLDKMTPQEWAEHQKKRHEFMDKWKSMTPEQKEEMRKKRAEHREEWNKMTPEQREAKKKEWQEKHAKKEGDKAAAPAAPTDSGK